MVLPLLAESICQPRQSPNLHPHREVLALDMRGANLRPVGIAENWFWSRLQNIWRGVPALAVLVLTIDLNQHSVIHAISQRVADSLDVGRKSIAADLKALRRCRVAQPLDEQVRRGLAAPAQREV